MLCCTIPLLVVAIGAGPGGLAMQDVVRGNDRFAGDLYGKLRGRPGNLVFSPYSISSALAMTQAGAGGATAKEMADTLHLPVDARAVDSGFAALRALIGGEDEARPCQIRTANALWGQRGLAYREPFLRRAEAAHGAGLRQVDFANDPRGARTLINDWVEAQTRDKIKDLLGPSDIRPGTDLILTNAIYFKGAWAAPFPRSATRDEPFRGGGEAPRPVPTMHLTDEVAYLEGDDFQAIELPYVGQDLAMVILLPRRDDGLGALEASLSGGKLGGWVAKLARARVEVSLPRFKLESGIELAEALGSLGMPTAFGDKADFSGIATDRRLILSAVIHKAFAEVNEEGTEAAAATAVVMLRSLAVRAPLPPVVFRADHPFLFAIREIRSGSILFLGRVARP